MALVTGRTQAAIRAREHAEACWETYYRAVLEDRPADERCTAFVRAVKADDHAARLKDAARRARTQATRKAA